MPAMLVSERGYARPELLVETGWLAQNLENPAVRIIDTRPPELYAAGHIPGAVSLAAAGAIPRADNADMGEPQDFARLAGALGVGNDTRVVTYDAPGAAMGMLAWAFMYFGHTDVQMLDGGFAKWSREDRPVSTEASAYPAAVFEPALAEEIYCSLDQAKASHGQPGTIFWDTRRPDEYGGTAPAGANPLPRPGHIPNAVHLDWTELLDPDLRTFKTAGELTALLGARGITPESEVNCY